MSRVINMALALIAGTSVAAGAQAAPALAAPAQAATAAATPKPSALLVGELGIEGGAYPGTFHPTAGYVEVEFDRLPLVIEKHVNRSGQFRFHLAPGTYTVIGCGPGANGTPSNSCSTPETLTLAAGQVDYLQLIWAHVP